MSQWRSEPLWKLSRQRLLEALADCIPHPQYLRQEWCLMALAEAIPAIADPLMLPQQALADGRPQSISWGKPNLYKPGGNSNCS